MLIKLRERMGREEGFTLIELLVVMLILGILAAIAIPSFFNQRDKARDADAKAGARTMQTAMETYATNNGGSYAGVAADGSTLAEIEPTLNDLPALAVALNGTPVDGYTVTATSETDNTFSLTRAANGQTTSDCETTGDAGCPSDGNWTGKGPTATPTP